MTWFYGRKIIGSIHFPKSSGLCVMLVDGFDIEKWGTLTLLIAYVRTTFHLALSRLSIPRF